MGFAHNIKTISIAFLRYEKSELKDIIIEVTGIKGQNAGQYKNYTYYSKYDTVSFNEVFRETQYCLKNNPNWLIAVENIYNYIKSKNKYQTITINIYNPPSILYSIYRFSIGDDGYLPVFIISVFNKEQNIFEVFKGQISWNGNYIDNQNLSDLLPMDKSFNLMSALTSDSFREEYEEVLGIEFEIFQCVNIIKNNKPLDRKFYPVEFERNHNIRQIESYNYDLDELILHNQTVIEYIKRVIRSNSLRI